MLPLPLSLFGGEETNFVMHDPVLFFPILSLLAAFGQMVISLDMSPMIV